MFPNHLNLGYKPNPYESGQTKVLLTDARSHVNGLLPNRSFQIRGASSITVRRQTKLAHGILI